MSQATTVVGNRLDALCDNVLSDVVAWRRHLHAHPELSFEEHQTAQFIVDRLADAESIEIGTRPSGTSVVGELQGGSPGPTVAIRADFDALPILEETGLSFASTTPGVMHACGHDGHTSILVRRRYRALQASDRAPRAPSGSCSRTVRRHFRGGAAGMGCRRA